QLGNTGAQGASEGRGPERRGPTTGHSQRTAGVEEQDARARRHSSPSCMPLQRACRTACSPMSISHARRWLAAASVLACTAGLGAETSSPPPEVQALTPAARAEYDKVLEDEFCGCGAPHTLARCLKTRGGGRHSRRVAAIAALEAGRGVTASEIGVELARYEQGFRDSRRKFTIDDRQCTGKAQPPVT